jgi:hypothetical protein
VSRRREKPWSFPSYLAGGDSPLRATGMRRGSPPSSADRSEAEPVAARSTAALGRRVAPDFYRRVEWTRTVRKEISYDWGRSNRRLEVGRGDLNKKADAGLNGQVGIKGQSPW